MKLLKYVIPAVILNKVYKKRYTKTDQLKSEDAKDRESDTKDDE